MEASPLIDTRRVPIMPKKPKSKPIALPKSKRAARTKKAAAAPVQPVFMDSVSNIVAKAEEDLQSVATNVADRADRTDIHAEAAGEVTGEGQLEGLPQVEGVISERLPIKKPRVPRKKRAALAEPVNPVASVEALAEASEVGDRYFVPGVENRSRHHSLNTEPKQTVGYDAMDMKDPSRLMDSDLNKLKPFADNDSKGNENLRHFEPAVVRAAPNKEYIREEKVVKPVKRGFDASWATPFNDPYTAPNSHPQFSQAGGFWLG
jgi:hypothetical protein